MQCQVCGADALPGLNFCPGCGSPIGPSPIDSAPAATGVTQPSGPPPGPRTATAPDSQVHHCRSCNSLVHPGASACQTCGHPPLSGTSFCFRCGNPTNPMTDPCPHCQSRLVSAPAATMPSPMPMPAPQYQPYPQPTPVYAPPPYPQVVYPTPMMMMTPPKSKAAAALLCFFFGGLGVHRFYTGQVGLGVALLLQTLVLGPLTLGIWWIVVFVWIFVDFILILTGGVKDQYGRPLA